MFRRRRYGMGVGGIGGLFLGLVFGAIWLVTQVVGIQLPFGGVTSGSQWQLLGSGQISRRALTPTSTTFRSKSFSASQGQTIEITYSVMAEKGMTNVVIYERPPLLQASTKIWSADLKRSEKKTVRIRAPRSSHYEVYVSLWGFKGDLDIQWSVK